MHEYQASIRWTRDGTAFTDNRYSRRHTWTFDGGTEVPASSSPRVVPLPYSDESAVDPEEALVASASSCHMLWFLSLAARGGFLVESYEDDAVGVMEKDATGKMAFSSITLRPRIEFSREKTPTADDLASLHRAAHEECYIANSLKCEVRVLPGSEEPAP